MLSPMVLRPHVTDAHEALVEWLLAREKQITRRNTSLSATLPARNPTWTALGLNLDICGGSRRLIARAIEQPYPEDDWTTFLRNVGNFWNNLYTEHVDISSFETLEVTSKRRHGSIIQNNYLLICYYKLKINNFYEVY